MVVSGFITHYQFLLCFLCLFVATPCAFLWLQLVSLLEGTQKLASFF